MGKLNLTKMQEDFIVNYVSNGNNAHKAALDAGYSKSFASVNSYDLLKKPAIHEKLLAVQATSDPVQVSFDMRVDKLLRVLHEFIPSDTSIPLQPMSVRVGLQALAELNKMHGDYAPQKVLRMTVDATKQRLDDASKAYEEY